MNETCLSRFAKRSGKGLAEFIPASSKRGSSTVAPTRCDLEEIPAQGRDGKLVGRDEKVVCMEFSQSEAGKA